MPDQSDDTPSPGAVGRRSLFGGGGLALTGWALIEALSTSANAQSLTHAESVPPNAIVVTLLGTGSPELRLNRFGGSTLVQAGGQNFLFDAGRGCTLRLGQLQIPLGQVGTVFLTHFHSDHLNGLPDLWLTGYIQAPYASRHGPLQIIGPPGTIRLAEAMHTTFGDDIRIRMADEKTPETATEIEPHEFAADGVVYDQHGVTITAFEVDHGPLVKPAYGYRIDHAGRSVVISGDTRYNENVIRHATGVDLLVHEVCAVSEGLADNPMAQAILNHHTSPERAGEVFAQAKPKLAAYTHVGQVSWPPNPPITTDDIARRTRTTYDGPLEIGEDLTRFVVADGVEIHRWDIRSGKV